MVVHTGWVNENEPKPFQFARWDNKNEWFKIDNCAVVMTVCCYAYIGYAPSEYKTHEVLKCADDSNCKIGCEDDGYCMYDFCNCEQQRRVNEYTIEEKAIWKEFE